MDNNRMGGIFSVTLTPDVPANYETPGCRLHANEAVKCQELETDPATVGDMWLLGVFLILLTKWILLRGDSNEYGIFYMRICMPEAGIKGRDI